MKLLREYLRKENLEMSDLDQLLELVDGHTLDHLDTPCCDVCVEINSLKAKIDKILQKYKESKK